jgi:ADP-heptose:LPS heptosyltransferase
LISKTPELAKKTRFWIRLPAQLDEILRIIPSIRALQKARPDGEFTLILRNRYIPLLKCLQIGDNYLALPDRDLRSFLKIFKWRLQYPDTLIVFPSSIRHDIEAWLIGSYQRFGVEINGRQRPLLTHTWKVPKEIDHSTLHQSRIWEMFFRHFGLLTDPDFSPLEIPEVRLPSHLALPTTILIGIVPGADNNQTKCWPITHWKKLLKDLSREQPSLHFVLFGNPSDRLNVHQITQNISKDSVHNFTGQCSLVETAHLLKKCDFVIGNDVGNLHLANALGVPVIGLYGPSNPIRTGPIFAGSTQVIQPPHSQPTGATHLSDLQPRQVKQVIQVRLNRIQNSISKDPR